MTPLQGTRTPTCLVFPTPPSPERGQRSSGRVRQRCSRLSVRVFLTRRLTSGARIPVRLLAVDPSSGPYFTSPGLERLPDVRRNRHEPIARPASAAGSFALSPVSPSGCLSNPGKGLLFKESGRRGPLAKPTATEPQEDPSNPAPRTRRRAFAYSFYHVNEAF